MLSYISHVTWYRNGKCKQRKLAVYMFWHFSLHKLTCDFKMGLHGIFVTSDFRSNHKKISYRSVFSSLPPMSFWDMSPIKLSYLFCNKSQNSSETEKHIINHHQTCWSFLQMHLKAYYSLSLLDYYFVNLFVETNHIFPRCLNSFPMFRLW